MIMFPSNWIDTKWSLHEVTDSICTHWGIITIGIVTGTAVILLRRYRAGGRCYSRARLDGKTVIITGGNTGIGKETARDLMCRGARVILACRNPAKAHLTAARLVKETYQTNIDVRELDLASIASIREFCSSIQESEKHLDILINNAGVMACPLWKTTDGFEMQFGVNHLGQFLLTNLLLDLIKSSAPARIINVSSLVHAHIPELQFDHLNNDGTYDAWNAYSNSKLCNILFSRELARKLTASGVTVYSLHPGLVWTELGRHLHGLNQPAWRHALGRAMFWLVSKSATQGAQTTIHCAVSEELASQTGLYYSDCAVTEPSDGAKDDEAARRLWDISEKLLSQKF